MNRPNVLLLTIDTLRKDGLGCYGNPHGISPYMDGLAQRGARFDPAITGGSWTQAAFPVMLTSSYASMFGGCLGPLSTDRPGPIEDLQAIGYQTAAFSTSPLLSRAYGYDRGFDRFEDLSPGEKDPSLRGLKGGERLLRNRLFQEMAGLAGGTVRPARLYVSAEQLVDRVTDWVEGVQTPFFGWAHFMDIHWPYHREESLSSPAEVARAWQDLAHLHQVNWKGAAISTAQKKHYRELYERAVEYTDQQIGRLLDTLERFELLEDTVVILVSDHGEEFLEHGRWGHFENNLHDEILQVPLVISSPDMVGPTVISQQVSLIDLMPTILDLCGCEPSAGMEGRSLRPLWSGSGRGPEHGVAISEMWRDGWHIIAVRTAAFKYIWDNRAPERPRLFDLMADPDETVNRVEHYPDDAQRFQQIVDRHLAEVERTSPLTAVELPAHDDEILRRLRDLGYVE